MQTPESDNAEIGAKVFDWMARQISSPGPAKMPMGRAQNANWISVITPTANAPAYVGRRTYRDGIEVKEGDH